MNSKQTNDVSVRAKPKKFLEDNTRVNFHDLDFAMDSSMTPKAHVNIGGKKEDKSDIIKAEIFFASKDTIKKVKRQPTVTEKYIHSFLQNVHLPCAWQSFRH